MTESQRTAMLELPSGKVSILLDTDAACEIDDQFAIAYAVRAAEAGELVLEGIHASLSGNVPAEGLERNYQEILTVLEHLHSPAYTEKVFRGCTETFTGEPVLSDAVKNMIRAAKDETREGPLYVVSIGGGTNIANALKAAPEIIDNIVLVWVAGTSLHWNNSMECNLYRDTAATEYIFQSGVPMVLLPAYNVISELRTTIFELEHYLSDKNEICDYLLDLVRNYHGGERIEGTAWSKVIWDVAGIAYILRPWDFTTRLVPTPVFSYHWASDPLRHRMRIADNINRDRVFMDLFTKLTT